ncbi:cytochrome P450 [Lentzea roselyniae]
MPDVTGWSAAVGEIFDPFQSEQLQDPYPVYALARREEPVFYSEKMKMWYVTRYDDIVAITKQPKRFSSSGAIDVPLEQTERTRRGIAESWIAQGSLTNNDPPSHDVIRRLVSRAFSRREVAGLEEPVQRVIDELVDSFAADGHVELVQQFNFPATLRIILDHIGVDAEDPMQLRRWSDDWLAINHLPMTPDEQHATLDRLLECQEFWIDLIEQKRRAQAGDLLGEIIRASEEDSSRIPLLQLVNICMTLYVAGHTTTTDLLSLCVHRLMSDREQWQLVLDDENNIARAIEETLHVDSPVHALMRTTTEPVVVGGVHIAAGERIALLYASANHDEKYFAADRGFDLRHEYPKTHLTFGHGIHFCLGAPLARLVARLSVRTLARRLPGLRLSPEHRTAYVVNPIHRGLAELRLDWTPVGGR